MTEQQKPLEGESVTITIEKSSHTVNRHDHVLTVTDDHSDSLSETVQHEPNSPLWKRVPTKDAEGAYLGDFMMIIPGLKNLPPEKRLNTLNKLAAVLNYYQETVVFADLNMKMNLLWVSIKPVKGMFIEIPAAIISRIPEAKLISDRAPRI